MQQQFVFVNPNAKEVRAMRDIVLVVVNLGSSQRCSLPPTDPRLMLQDLKAL